MAPDAKQVIADAAQITHWVVEARSSLGKTEA